MKEQEVSPMPDAVDNPETKKRLVLLQAMIDQRDETIRLLNEALSLALAELEFDQAA